VGTDAVLLAVTLLAIGILLTYLGTRFSGAVRIKRPGKAVSVFMILIWGLSLATFLIALSNDSCRSGICVKMNGWKSDLPLDEWVNQSS
jgi:hypothetical protein